MSAAMTTVDGALADPASAVAMETGSVNNPVWMDPRLTSPSSSIMPAFLL
jgi:hypothetical protein